MTNKLDFRIFDIKNPISKSNFEQFYALMESSFPKEERRSRKGFEELIKCSENYKIYCLFKGSELTSFFTVWEFEDFRFGDHFAVSPQMRNSGIGTFFLQKLLSQSSLPFILEAELPEEEMAVRRLNFYERNGFKKNDFPYMLPAMQEGCEAIAMNILSFPEKLSQSEFNRIKDTLYLKVYNVKTAL